MQKITTWARSPPGRGSFGGRRALPAYRGGRPRGSAGAPKRYPPFYGLTLVSCERGDIRQSPDGLIIYDEQERREVTFDADRTGRDVMVDEMYRAIASGEPPLHDGRWGLATLEVCLAVLESGRERREVLLRPPL